MYRFSASASRALTALAVSALCASSVPLAWQANAQALHNGQDSVLSRRYTAAQAFQAQHQMDKAAGQYRIFLADAMGQLAMGHVRSGDREQAAAEFDEALSLVPDFPALKLQYARMALDMGNAERAQNLASSVLQAHPADPKAGAAANTILGSALMQSGKMHEARPYFERAVAMDPSFQNGYRLAVVDLDLGDGSAADRVFAEMQSSFSDTAEIHLLFGQAYARSDFQPKALAEFQKSEQKDPKLPGVHYAVAWMLMDLDGSSAIGQAEDELRKEIANSPEDAGSYAALGHLLADQHKGDEAVADLKRAISLDPTNPNSYFYLGQYELEMKNLPEAIALLRRAIALTTDPAAHARELQKAHYLLGRALLQSGDAEAGKRELAASQAAGQQNLSRDQDRLRVYLDEPAKLRTTTSPASTFAPVPALKDPAIAKQVATFQQQFGPAIADSYNNLGAIAGSEGNFPVALRYFERAEEWSPAMPGLDMNWGRAAFRAGQEQEAIGPLTRHLSAHPEDAEARGMLGVALADGRQFAQARQVLAPLADAADANPAVQLAFSEALMGTGEKAQAEGRLRKLEESLSAALRRNPSDTQLRAEMEACRRALQTK